MSANYQPQNAQVRVSAGNSNLSPNSGDPGVVTLLTGAGAFGSIITSITVKATAAVSEGMIRVFSDIVGAAPLGIIFEIRVPAASQGNTYPAWGITVPCNIAVQTGKSIYVTTQNSNTFVVTAGAYSIQSMPS